MKKHRENKISNQANAYYTYQKDRRAMSSYSLNRSREDAFGIGNRQGGISSRKNLHKSYIQQDKDLLDSEHINEKLQLYNKRMQESTERRDKSLETRVQPIKEHLGKISTVIKVINQSNEDLLRDNMKNYYEKEKKIAEARKKRKQLNIKYMTEQEINFSNGNFEFINKLAFKENRKRLMEEEKQHAKSIIQKEKEKEKMIMKKKLEQEEERIVKPHQRQGRTPDIRYNYDKYLRPNPKKVEAEITRQVNNIIIRNDMKHREELISNSCKY